MRRGKGDRRLVPSARVSLLALAPIIPALLFGPSGCDIAEILPGSGSQGDGPHALSSWGSDDASAPGNASPVHPLYETPRTLSHRLDPDLLAEALELAATLPRLHNMIVARHGEVVVERHFRGRGLDTPANVKSASKSILSAVVGIAIEEGHLEGLDQPIVPFFARYLSEEELAERAGITLGDLLTMQAGLESTSMRNYGRWVTSSDWVRHAITRPMQTEPGRRMVYSTGSTHLLSAVVTQATGQSTWAYARDKLARPLEIQLPPWLTDPQGIYFGGNDMAISPRGLLRFGEMYRNGGELDGVRVVSREWVESSWEVHGNSPRNANVYGLGWWGRTTNGYQVRFAWGYGGQFLFIVPALELTVVFTSDPVSPREGPHNRQLHRMIDELLVPAAMAGAERPAAPQ